jgi:hypothetical protein
MPTPNWNAEIARQEIARLLAPGILGFYTHFEVTEIFATPPGRTAPINLFTIFVAEERAGDATAAPHYVTPKPLRVPLLKGWTFGIERTVRPIGDLVPLFDAYCETKEWSPSNEPLEVGALAPLPPQFVPPDSTGTVPLNRVLKNNFWNGSHVFEWADPAKTPFKPLFDQPLALQNLSATLQAYVPIQIASLSDRLGNVVVQLPITVLMAKFGQLREAGDFTVSLTWHQQANPRPLRASCEKQYDHTVVGFMSADATAAQTRLPMPDGPGLHRAVVWDGTNRLLIAASGELGFVATIALNMHVQDPEPRVFAVRDRDGVEKVERVYLANVITNQVGEPADSATGDWTSRRIYREDLARATAAKRFLQYRPRPGQENAEHEKALADVRALIRSHSAGGVWLWDPYLSASDILKTLFYASIHGVELRGLTAGREFRSRPPPAAPATLKECVRECLSRLFGRRKAPPPAEPSFADKQRAILDDCASNYRGLRLEYRMKTGPAGWGFHDRFLIFPGADRGALAWSLGTSINSLGRQHHILQQVTDGQLIADAFRQLWDELGTPECLIWKKP